MSLLSDKILHFSSFSAVVVKLDPVRGNNSPWTEFSRRILQTNLEILSVVGKNSADKLT